MILLFVVIALVVVAVVVRWARHYRAYGLALVPSRRQPRTGVERRLTAIDPVAPDRVALVFESTDADRLEMVVVQPDDRALAMETLEAWRQEQAPLAVTPWGRTLIRLRRLDSPVGLTLRRDTT